jgi:ABC-type transport system involved in multi-copper enzyme maturation permease subunit
MKTLVCKEFRENVKLAVLGVIIYAVVLLVQYRGYVALPANMSQPLTQGELLWSTGWFCGIFGAVLGWLQIHNERRPDLWAFLLHRPMTRTGIFLAKTLAGLGLYALVVGLPLLGFITWALLPGHVPAPFELAMLRPVTAVVLTGILYYLAGILTGLRQARWYASRALGLGVAITVTLVMPLWPQFWQGFLFILVGAAILATAAWGGFQSHGYYRRQPVCGKAALTTSLMLGNLLVVFLAAMLLVIFLSIRDRTVPWTYYAQTVDGPIYKVTQGPGQASAIVDLEGKPLIDAKTGRMIELSTFNLRFSPAFQIATGQNETLRPRQWMQADTSLASSWRGTRDTLWFYWGRYGRLVGYDIATRRCIGSLGPKGFAPDLSGGGDRFSNSTEDAGSGTLCTETVLYAADPEKRATRELFATTSDDPILARTEITLHNDHWEHTAVVTKRFVHLLTAEGKPLWKTPYEPKDPAYTALDLHPLEPPGQFALWIAPIYWDQDKAKNALPTRVLWLASGQGVVKSADLPPLPSFPAGRSPEETAMCAVTPPALLLLLPHLPFGHWSSVLVRQHLLASWSVAILVCLPIGLWLGRRYRFSIAAQAGWVLFLMFFGVPGLLAFLSVQEWPARESCPNCKRLRLVDRPQCEHCRAEFPPPEETGTEVFAPLTAKVEIPAGA